MRLVALLNKALSTTWSNAVSCMKRLTWTQFLSYASYSSAIVLHILLYKFCVAMATVNFLNFETMFKILSTFSNAIFICDLIHSQFAIAGVYQRLSAFNILLNLLYILHLKELLLKKNVHSVCTSSNGSR